MQLHDLVKPLSEQTDEELMATILRIRQNRNVVKPAAKKHEKEAKKKEGKATVNKLSSLLAGLSESDLEKLKAELSKPKDS